LQNRTVCLHSLGMMWLSFLVLSFLLILMISAASAASVKLAWDQNPESDLAGYRVYYGTKSRNYSQHVEVGKSTTCMITDLAPGTTYYFAATACDISNVESDYSQEVAYQTPVEGNEKPSSPIVPEGPSAGQANSSYAYRTMAVDPEDDALEYRFDWGDGSLSAWGSAQQSHQWAAAGSYCARAIARDSFGAQSGWSACRSVAITNPASYSSSAGGGSPARLIRVSASSQSQGTGQTAAKAVDGVISGWPGDYTKEWATAGEKSGAWIKLEWDRARLVDRVVLYDRPNANDHITGARLSFSDGSVVTTGALDNGGGGTEVRFPARMTERLTLTVLSVGSSTYNIGLSEIEVFGAAAPAPSPEPSAPAPAPNPDKDNDGMPDEWESRNGLNPQANDAAADKDGDGIRNIDEYRNGSDPSVAEAPGQALPMEVGEVAVSGNWQRVAFKRSFNEPVVVANAISRNDSEPAVVRIRNLSRSGFDIRIQEWDYLDDVHAAETIGYIAMERGVYRLSDGTHLEADSFSTDRVREFGKVSFVQTFSQTPVVAACRVSSHAEEAINGRLREVTRNDFEFCLMKQESGTHSTPAETVHYIAWEPSVGTVNGLAYEVDRTRDAVRDDPYQIRFANRYGQAPLIVADMQTADGMDPAGLRWQNRDLVAVEVFVEEEQSVDDELDHTSEMVGYFVFDR